MILYIIVDSIAQCNIRPEFLYQIFHHPSVRNPWIAMIPVFKANMFSADFEASHLSSHIYLDHVKRKLIYDLICVLIYGQTDG